MTNRENDKNPATQPAAPEAPLTWTSKKEWGRVGNTHTAEVTLDNGDHWLFVVDQPYRGLWQARGWRTRAGSTGSGVFRFFREASAMKAAKAEAQAYANLAQTSTCTECGKVIGHKLDCSKGWI